NFLSIQFRTMKLFTLVPFFTAFWLASAQHSVEWTHSGSACPSASRLNVRIPADGSALFFSFPGDITLVQAPIEASSASCTIDLKITHPYNYLYSGMAVDYKVKGGLSPSGN